MVGAGDPEVLGGVEGGEEAGVAQAYGELVRAAPVVENLETVEALTGPKLTTQGLSWESMAME